MAEQVGSCPSDGLSQSTTVTPIEAEAAAAQVPALPTPAFARKPPSRKVIGLAGQSSRNCDNKWSQATLNNAQNGSTEEIWDHSRDSNELSEFLATFKAEMDAEGEMSGPTVSQSVILRRKAVEAATESYIATRPEAGGAVSGGVEPWGAFHMRPRDRSPAFADSTLKMVRMLPAESETRGDNSPAQSDDPCSPTKSVNSSKMWEACEDQCEGAELAQTHASLARISIGSSLSGPATIMTHECNANSDLFSSIAPSASCDMRDPLQMHGIGSVPSAVGFLGHGPFWTFGREHPRKSHQARSCRSENRNDSSQCDCSSIVASVVAPSELAARAKLAIGECANLVSKTMDMSQEPAPPEDELTTVLLETKEQRLQWRDFLSEAVSTSSVGTLFSAYDVEAVPPAYARPPLSMPQLGPLAQGYRQVGLKTPHVVAPKGAGWAADVCLTGRPPGSQSQAGHPGSLPESDAPDSCTRCPAGAGASDDSSPRVEGSEGSEDFGPQLLEGAPRPTAAVGALMTGHWLEAEAVPTPTSSPSNSGAPPPAG